MNPEFDWERDDDWQQLINNADFAFVSLQKVTRALIDTLRYERKVSDELAALVWLLPDDPDGRRNAALDLWRQARA